jgi:transposase
MIYARQPTDEERRELDRIVRQEVGRVSQRAQMILLSTRGKSVPELADLFGFCEPTVRFWIRRYDAEGPAGLFDRPRTGRPPKITDDVKKRMLRLIQSDPQDAGYLATAWTSAMVVLALAKAGIYVGVGAVRVALHQIGLRWGRPRLAMPAKVDPEKALKQWLYTQAAVKAPEGTPVLYADESRLLLLPLIRAMWHWVGEQIRVPTPGTNKSRALFGALNIRTGQWTYLVRERMRKEDFIAFLDHLLATYRTDPIILIVDNYSSHTARDVRTWLAEHQRIQLYYLPKYCSHLNPVERIWFQLKGQIAANRLYGSIQLLLQAAEAFFDEMTPERALVWASA